MSDKNVKINPWNPQCGAAGAHAVFYCIKYKLSLKLLILFCLFVVLVCEDKFIRLIGEIFLFVIWGHAAAESQHVTVNRTPLRR